MNKRKVRHSNTYLMFSDQIKEYIKNNYKKQTDKEIAKTLNKKGFLTKSGRQFTGYSVRHERENLGLERKKVRKSGIIQKNSAKPRENQLVLETPILSPKEENNKPSFITASNPPYQKCRTFLSPATLPETIVKFYFNDKKNKEIGFIWKEDFSGNKIGNKFKLFKNNDNKWQIEHPKNLNNEIIQEIKQLIEQSKWCFPSNESLVFILEPDLDQLSPNKEPYVNTKKETFINNSHRKGLDSIIKEQLNPDNTYLDKLNQVIKLQQKSSDLIIDLFQEISSDFKKEIFKLEERNKLLENKINETENLLIYGIKNPQEMAVWDSDMECWVSSITGQKLEFMTESKIYERSEGDLKKIDFQELQKIKKEVNPELVKIKSRDKLNRYIRKFCSDKYHINKNTPQKEKDLIYQEHYNFLYEQFKYINIKGRKYNLRFLAKKENMEILDFVEKEGLMDTLLALAVKIFDPDEL